MACWQRRGAMTYIQGWVGLFPWLFEEAALEERAEGKL